MIFLASRRAAARYGALDRRDEVNPTARPVLSGFIGALYSRDRIAVKRPMQPRLRPCEPARCLSLPDPASTMCGRYVLASPAEVLAEHFALARVPIYRASYNVAPTALVPVVRISKEGLRECVSMRWGFIPAWAKSITSVPMINNAREESIAGKPSFRAAYRARRAIVPADGYYEWDEKVTPRQPHYFRLAAGGLLGLAGLWERWRGPDGDTIESFAIVTGAANAQTAPIHDRMPRILAPGDYDRWLRAPDPRVLLAAAPVVRLAIHPVTGRVNRVANDGPENIETGAIAAADGRAKRQPRDDGEAPATPLQQRLF